MKNTLERTFQLNEAGTTIKTEIIAGTTTFLAMVYVIFVNPTMLSHAGMPFDAVFIATCLTTIFGSVVCALLANLPIAIAPSMGLNAYFTYIVVLHQGYSWETALGFVFIAGVIFFILTIFRIRQLIIHAIPNSLNNGIAAGIGLFIGLIALKNAGIIISSKSTLVALGPLNSPAAILCFLGLCFIIALERFRVPGAIIISILLISLIALMLGKTSYHGILSTPPSIEPTLLKFNFHQLLSHHGLIIIFTFVLVALFDSTGTLAGILSTNYTLSSPKTQKQIGRALMADSLATTAAGCLGTSTTATYIENSVGIRAGGRTGLTALTVAVLFALTIFIYPLAKMIPLFATAPALLYVACLMLGHIKKIHWDDLTEAVPAGIIAIMIPFSFSIADGVGLGFITYTIIKILSGKIRQLNWVLFILAIIFSGYFLSLAT